MIRLVFIVSIMLLAVSCEEDAIAPQAGSSYVVEAYIYAGKPIDHVKVTHVDPNGSWVSEAVYDADVEISQGGITHQLGSVVNCPACYGSSDSTAVFDAGDTLRLTIKKGNTEMRAIAAFPPAISGLVASTKYTQLAFHDANEPVLTLSWDAIPGYKYALFINSLEENPKPIWSSIPPQEHLSPFQGALEEHSAEIFVEHLSTYGINEIYVTAVSSSYASFIRRSNVPNAGVPFGNIENGEGIFAAFNGSAVSLLVE